MPMYLCEETEKTKRLDNGSQEGAQVAGLLETWLPSGAFDIHFFTSCPLARPLSPQLSRCSPWPAAVWEIILGEDLTILVTFIMLAIVPWRILALVHLARVNFIQIHHHAMDIR